MVYYLSVAQLLELHGVQLRHYGGLAGIRDQGCLEVACARPQMPFGGEDLYREFPDKAAALMHSLVMNHPVIDGNKRAVAYAALVFLLVYDWDVKAIGLGVFALSTPKDPSAWVSAILVIGFVLVCVLAVVVQRNPCPARLTQDQSLDEGY